MALEFVGESIRVCLPALLRAEQALESGAGEAAASVADARIGQALAATCTRLSATHAWLEAELAPLHGRPLELEIALPGRRELQFCGTITRSITTSAPALLCGARDQSLGARFELALSSSSRDLMALVGLLSRRRSQRQVRVRQLVRSAGIALPPLRNPPSRA
jgi:hypothetical protein